MGSIVLTGPMVRALRSKFTDAKITIFTFSANKEICELTQLFDEVVLINTNSFAALLSSVLNGMLYLRKQRFDICIDLEFFTKFSTILCYLSGSRIRVGYFLIQIGILLKMMWRGNLLTHQVYFNQHKHATEVFVALANSIGADTKDYSYAQLHLPLAASNSINQILSPYLKQKEKLIAVNVNASPLCLERRWPKENFAQIIIKLLSDAKEVKVALVGGKDDVPYVNSFLDILQKEINKDRIINLTGRLSIAELTALLMKAQLFITNDSGPLHIAVSLGKPTVSFFGPESPRRFGPKDDMHLVLYCEKVYCTPCLNVYSQKISFCNGNNICLKSIQPDDAYRLLRQKYKFLFQNE
ncbi:MAG: glycosyltransferase family 9 protein [Candidatus Omnitrophica bacterium]|nr:glycosyltransferase family 9 protein [Candidatus Omnitrophota bacterium]